MRKTPYHREPLVHFLLLGTALYAASTFFTEETEGATDDATIEISQAMVDAAATRISNGGITTPSQQEIDEEVQRLVREEVLFREAIRNGLAQDDLIIRRRLVQKMEQLIDALSEPEPPSEEQLREWYESHRDEYQLEARVSFTQVFFRRDREDALERAHELLPRLQAGEVDPTTVGDPFVLSNTMAAQRRRSLIRLFGPEATETLFDFPTGEWMGPLASHLGIHLIRIGQHEEARIPDYEEVRAQVETDLLRARKDERVGEIMEGLIDGYPVEIAEPSDVGAPLAWRQP